MASRSRTIKISFGGNHSKVQTAQKLFKFLSEGENDKFNALIDKIGQKDKKELEYILNEWTNNDKTEGHYLLTKATNENNIAIVQKILSFKNVCKVDVNVTMASDIDHWKYPGSSSLLIACHNDSISIGKLLLENGANANIIDASDRTAMSIIASKNDIDFSKLLIKHGFEFRKLINHTTKSGLSAFHNCLLNNSLDLLTYLYELSTNVNHINENVKLMLHNFIKPKRKRQSALQSFCDKSNDPRMLDFLLNTMRFCQHYSGGNSDNRNFRETVNIDYRDLQGRTAVWYAARKGSLKIVKMLAEHGCDLNAADNDGNFNTHLFFQFFNFSIFLCFFFALFLHRSQMFEICDFFLITNFHFCVYFDV